MAVDVENGKLPMPARTVDELHGILRLPKTVDVKEARRQYQDYLVQKLEDGKPRD